MEYLRDNNDLSDRYEQLTKLASPKNFADLKKSKQLMTKKR